MCPNHFHQKLHEVSTELGISGETIAASVVYIKKKENFWNRFLSDSSLCCAKNQGRSVITKVEVEQRNPITIQVY